MSTTNKKYNEENIRLAAYYNWQNAGCPNGKDEYFWNQAINQLYGSCKSSSCGCSSSKKTTKKASTSKSINSTKNSTSAKASTSTTNKITTSKK